MLDASSRMVQQQQFLVSDDAQQQPMNRPERSIPIQYDNVPQQQVLQHHLQQQHEQHQQQQSTSMKSYNVPIQMTSDSPSPAKSFTENPLSQQQTATSPNIQMMPQQQQIPPQASLPLPPSNLPSQQQQATNIAYPSAQSGHSQPATQPPFASSAHVPMQSAVPVNVLPVQAGGGPGVSVGGVASTEWPPQVTGVMSTVYNNLACFCYH